jgi:FKBP-type peptidyl-prolyl cis-trans isomerase
MVSRARRRLAKPRKVDLQYAESRNYTARQHHAPEKKLGQTYLDKAAAEKGASKTASGVIVSTIKPGTGPSPAASDRVKVHYTGTLIDGTVFDSSVQRGSPRPSRSTA